MLWYMCMLSCTENCLWYYDVIEKYTSDIINNGTVVRNTGKLVDDMVDGLCCC